MRRSGLMLLFAGTAILVTWPLAAHLTTTLPLGIEGSATVPLFNLWTMLWNAECVSTAYGNYWHAPIFHPEPGAFALSDPQPLTGLVFAMIRWGTQDAIASYNLVFLLFVTLNGVSAWLLLHLLGRSAAACVVAGLLAQTLPILTSEAGVLQLVAVFPVLLTLAALQRFHTARTLRSALWVGLGFAATFLTSEYYAVYLSIFLLLAIPFFARGTRWNRAAVGKLGVGIAVAAVLILPVALPQSTFTGSYSRSEESIRRTSARWVSWTHLPSGTMSREATGWRSSADGTRAGLYPGTALLALAGVAWWGRRRMGADRQSVRWITYGATATGLAVWLSLGPRFEVLGLSPYGVLRAVYPGLEQMRSPYRFAVFAQLFLVLLAGYGFDALARLSQRGRWVAMAIVVVGLLEVLPVPRRLAVVPGSLAPDWAAELRDLPDGAVVAVPFPASKRAVDYDVSVMDMLHGITHGKRLLNGYSGYLPDTHKEDFFAVRSFPDATWLGWARSRGVRYVIVDRDWLGRTLPDEPMPPELVPVVEHDGTFVFELSRDARATRARQDPAQRSSATSASVGSSSRRSLPIPR